MERPPGRRQIDIGVRGVSHAWHQRLTVWPALYARIRDEGQDQPNGFQIYSDQQSPAHLSGFSQSLRGDGLIGTRLRNTLCAKDDGDQHSCPLCIMIG